MEWTKELTLEFLALYEKEPIIWNPTNPQNKNRNLVHDSWRRIQQSLRVEFSITDLKKKKESLMATFRPLLNKFKANKKVGDSYTPSWFAFEIMERFLHRVYQSKTTVYTEDLVVVTEDSEQNEHTANEQDEEIQSTIAEDEDAGAKNTTNILFKTVPEPVPFTSPPERESRKRKKSTEKRESWREDSYKITKTACDKPDSDECTQYAALLVTKLRYFDEHRRDIIMNKIDNLIFEAKMQDRAQHFQSRTTTNDLDRCSTSSRSCRHTQSSQNRSSHSQLSPRYSHHSSPTHSYHSQASPEYSNHSPNSSHAQTSFSLQPITARELSPIMTIKVEETSPESITNL